MKTSIIVVAIVLIVVVGGGALGTLYFTGYFNQQPVTVRVGYLNGDLHNLSLHVAVAEGYFNQSGILVQLIGYPNGPTLMQSFVKGDLDFAYLGVVPAMTARANALIASNSSSLSLPVVIGSVNQEGSEIVVNQGITSISQLNGTTIATPGVGTIQDLLLTLFEQENDINFTKVPSTNAQLISQFKAGEFNGFMSWEPTPSVAVAQDNGTIIATSHDIFPDHQCCVLVVSDKFLASNPDVVSKFVADHKEAMDLINSNPAEVKAIAVNYTGFSAAIINTAYSNILFNETVNVASVKTFMQDEIALGIITTVNSTQVDAFMSGFIDSQYVH
ncbi:MAG: ABC transporter substrate-binding protein [Candidatus Methanomethylicaceae archaeon]|jgi:NitT/TauT family transport system substrate-binding protein